MSKKGKDKEKEKEIQSSSDYTSPFGTPLTKLPLCTTASGIPSIPVFVHSALTYLEQYGGTQLEGIFRISGSTQNVQRLKQAFATGEKTIFTKGDDLYDVACLVKLFFRELPESLCTFELYDCFIAAQGFPPDHIIGAIGKVQQNLFKSNPKVIDLLPSHNKFLLMYLSEFMQKVTKHESVNKMGPNNLAIVFTPNILRAKIETIESIVGDSQRAHQITLAFFEQSDELFKKYREKIEKDKNAMIASDEQKAREFKEEMEKRYKNHHSETEAKLQQEFNSKQTTQEAEEYEKQLAETVAKLSVGLVDEHSLQNGESWDASEYKQVYNRTLRGFKNKTRPSATVVSSGEKRSVLGRQRNSEQEQTTNTEDHSTTSEKKEFKMDKNTPMDLSKMYFGKR